MKDCYKIPTLDGTNISFNSKSDAAAFLLQHPDIVEYTQNLKKAVEDREKNAGSMLQTQVAYLTANKPVMAFGMTKDNMNYYGGNSIRSLNIDNNPKEWDAPTLELHKEGQEFVNSVEFKIGTPVFYGYSERTPYNTEYGFDNFKQLALTNDENLKFTKLSAMVFVDNQGKALDKAVVEDMPNLTKLLQEGNARVKYIGTFYEYNNRKDPNEIIQGVRDQLKDRGATYKRNVAAAPGINVGNDIIHISQDSSERVSNIVGFNKNLAVETVYRDANGKKTTKENSSSEQLEITQRSLTRTKWFDKNNTPVLAIIGQDKDGLYAILNNGQRVSTESFGATEPGRVHILIPANINSNAQTNISIDKQNHFPVRLYTKAWKDNPIFGTRFKGIIMKIFKGDISFNILSKDKGYVLENVVDKTTLAYNNDKVTQGFKDYWLNAIYNRKRGYEHIANAFAAYAVENNLANNTANIDKFLEATNMTFTGDVYSSLVADRPIDFQIALQEFLGLATFQNQDYPQILKAAKQYNAKYQGADNQTLTDAYNTFFNEDREILADGKILADKPSQIDKMGFGNINYLQKYVYKYGLLQTNLTEERPLANASFFTQPFDDLTDDQQRTFEMLDDLGMLNYSTDFNTEETVLDETTVKEVVDTYFPGATVELVDGLIDDIANGSFNLLNDVITASREYVTTGVIKEEFGHKLFKYQAQATKDELYREISEKTGIPIENKIALEEALMAEIRASDQLPETSAIKRFFNNIKQLLKSLFNNISAIETFKHQYYNNNWKKFNNKPTIQNVGIRYSLSPKYAKLSNVRIKDFIDTINRNYLLDVLNGTSLVNKIDSMVLVTGMVGKESYTATQALNDLYGRVRLKINAEIRKYEKSDSPLDKQDKDTLEYLLALMNEPAFDMQLRKDLENTHGVSIGYDVELEDKESLGLVKETEPDVIQKLGINLKVLINSIPDSRIDDNAEVEGAVTSYAVIDGQRKLQKTTPVTKLRGVKYGVKPRTTDKYTYRFNYKDRAMALLQAVSNSYNKEEMMAKLKKEAAEGPAWMKVLAFKVLEDDLLGDGILSTELWAGMGQNYFVNYNRLIKRNVEGNDERGPTTIYKLVPANMNRPQAQLEKQMLEQAQAFNTNAEVVDQAKNVKEAIKLLDKNFTRNSFEQNFPEIMRLLGFSTNNINLGNIKGYSSKWDNIKNLLIHLANSYNRKGPLGLVPGYDLILDTSLAKENIKDLSKILSGAVQSARQSSFRVEGGKMKQSYRYPNFILRTLSRLIEISDVNTRYSNMLGMRWNPLIKMGSDKTYKGKMHISVLADIPFLDKTFGDLTPAERVYSLYNAGENNNYSGNYWIGNLSDSATPYMLEAPVLDEKQIHEKTMGLFMQQLEYLLSPMDDVNFSKNREKGFLYEGMNKIVFGKEVLTKADLDPARYIEYSNNLNINSDRIKAILDIENNKNFEEFFDEYFKTIPNAYKNENIKNGDSSRLKDHVRKWYNNANFYQNAFLHLYMGHPGFAKSTFDISKRAKQIHTDGILTEDDSPIKFIILKDKLVPSSDKFLAQLDDLDPATAEIAKKSYSNNKITDSQSYGSLYLLRLRKNENEGWSEDDEALLQAEINLDIAAINRLAPKVSWTPAKPGVFAHEEIEAGYDDNGFDHIIRPIIQKYGMHWLLPSTTYWTKDGRLIRPDILAEELKIPIEEVYSLYKHPIQAKLLHGHFKLHDKENIDRIDYAFYGSAAKYGEGSVHDLEGTMPPVIREISNADMKKVTEQPDKNNLKPKIVSAQLRAQMFGLIRDDITYDLGRHIADELKEYFNGTKVTGAQLRELLDKLLAAEIKEGLDNLPFVKAGVVDVKLLSLYLTDQGLDSSWATPEAIKALDLNPRDDDFLIKIYNSSFEQSVVNILTSAYNKVLDITSNSPNYKNIAGYGDLKTRIYKDGAETVLEYEVRVSKWPELIEYQTRKLQRESKDLNDPLVWKESDEALISELQNIGFKQVMNRIPTEYSYSYARPKIVEFWPAHMGSAIEMPIEITTQTGMDYDGDSIFNVMSSVNYSGESLQLYSPRLTSKEGRQSLLALISNLALKYRANEMRYPGEQSVLKELAEKETKPEFMPGTLEHNLYSEKLNSLAEDVISPNAVTMSFQTFLNGFFQKDKIILAKPIPKLDRAYSGDITTWKVDAVDITTGKVDAIDKNQLLANNTSAAVNEANDLTLSLLHMTKELDNIKGFMTVLGVGLEYSVEFLNAPVIQEYVKLKQDLKTLLPDYEYKVALLALKARLIESNPLDYYKELELIRQNDGIIGIKDLHKEGNQAEILVKYLDLESASADYTKLTITYAGLIKSGKPSPTVMRDMVINLIELPKVFTGLDKLFPTLGYKNNNFVIVKKSPIDLMNSIVEVMLAKVQVMKTVTTYFHPTYLSLAASVKDDMTKYLLEQDNKELNGFMKRYVRSKQVKPLIDLMHLGRPAKLVNGVTLFQTGSLADVKSKVLDLLNSPSTPNKGSLQKIATTLGYLERGQQVQYIKDQNTVGVTYDIVLTPGLFQDSAFLESFEAGFMEMWKSDNELFKTFARDLRDYAVYKGFERGGNNFGALIPATTWTGMEETFDQIMNKATVAEIHNVAVRNNPKKFSLSVSMKALKEVNKGLIASGSTGIKVPGSIKQNRKNSSLTLRNEYPKYLHTNNYGETLILEREGEGNTYKVINSLGHEAFDDFTFAARSIILQPKEQKDLSQMPVVNQVATSMVQVPKQAIVVENVTPTKVESKLKKQNIFTVTPIQSADKKATVKASVANKYIGFGEGIEGSSTAEYGKQINEQVKQEFTPEDIQSLKPNEIFVFGSNTEGRHGRGAALTAKTKFGAKQGQSEGLQGQSYAIVTKDLAKGERSDLNGYNGLDFIDKQIGELIAFAYKNPNFKFYVAKIGTVLAGWTIKEIGEIWNNQGILPNNIILPKEFENYVNKDNRENNSNIVNSGNYNSNDIVFVSIGGKRGNEQVRKEQQDKTIKEALQAIEAGATLITDNKAYVESSDYNEGEKRLAKNLEAKGYNYSEQTIDGQLLGVWRKTNQIANVSDALYNEYVNIQSGQELISREEFMKASLEEQQTMIDQRKKC